MKITGRIYQNHFAGDGGILELLPIAVPMFISSMFDMLMLFVDRLFLARVGVVHQAAAMSGGITSWMVASFFVGMVAYSATLIAQYYGAGQKSNCVRMVWQALLIAVLSYPLMLLIDALIAVSPIFSRHSELEQTLELRYFWYMAFGGILALFRFAFGSFFIGIGRTKIIMVGNIVALSVNVLWDWILIFGHFGFPALGLDGAAIGSLLAALSAAIVMTSAFWRAKREPEWLGSSSVRIEWVKIGKILRYGLPQGVENVLGMICFVFLVSSFHSYGDDMAAATTIVFTWDGISFHPLLGLQAGVMTLVGRFMGRGRPDLAVRAAHSGFKVAILFAVCMIVLFLTQTDALVSVFAPANSILDYSRVREFALPMLQLAGCYLMTDAVLMISAGVLRGAGDTLWSMTIHFINNLLISIICLICVYKLELPPLRVWIYFVIMGGMSSLMFLVRYRVGRWKQLRIIENN